MMYYIISFYIVFISYVRCRPYEPTSSPGRTKRAEFYGPPPLPPPQPVIIPPTPTLHSCIPPRRPHTHPAWSGGGNIIHAGHVALHSSAARPVRRRRGGLLVVCMLRRRNTRPIFTTLSVFIILLLLLYILRLRPVSSSF